MGFGIQKALRRLNTRKNCLLFSIRRILLGFEYANLFLSRLDKYSVLTILKANGAKIGDHCDIETGITFHNCHNYENLVVGNNCHIGKNCFLDLSDQVIIHDNVTISMQSLLITHIDLGKSQLAKKYPSTRNSIIIEENVYIGAQAIVLHGIVIAKDSIVAASSLVNRNVEPFVLVAGVPFKIVKKLQSIK